MRSVEFSPSQQEEEAVGEVVEVEVVDEAVVVVEAGVVAKLNTIVSLFVYCKREQR